MALVPLYRLQGHGDHFYTTSEVERDNAVAQYGYAIEGIACYVSDSPTPQVSAFWMSVHASAVTALTAFTLATDAEIAQRAGGIADACEAALMARGGT